MSVKGHRSCTYTGQWYYYFWLFESQEQINHFLNWFIKMLFHLVDKRQLFCNFCFLIQSKLSIFSQYPVKKVLWKKCEKMFLLSSKKLLKQLDSTFCWMYFSTDLFLGHMFWNKDVVRSHATHLFARIKENFLTSYAATDGTESS